MAIAAAAAGAAARRDKQKQLLLWEGLFCRPWEWWDNRPNKRGPRDPDFRHQLSREPLWLNSPHKPPWVESRLPSLFTHECDTAPASPWHALFHSLCVRGELDSALHVLSCHLAQFLSAPLCPSIIQIYLSLLKACAKARAPTQTALVRQLLLQRNLELSGLLGDHLVVALANCGAIDDALQVLSSLPQRTVYSWTAMISALAEHGRGREALQLYYRMQADGIAADEYTFVSLVKACISIYDLKEAGKLHGDAESAGFASNVFVGSTLISMYGKCGNIFQAENVFNGLLERNAVSWNAMLSAYVDQGLGERTLCLYRQMQEEGVDTGEETLVITFQACGALGGKEEVLIQKGQRTRPFYFDIGRALHADAQRVGFASGISIGSVLVSMYGKCGSLVHAESVFDSFFEHNVVSWNALMSAYVEQDQQEEALQLYRQMQEEGVSPILQTIIITLQACGILGGKEQFMLEKGQYLNIGHALHFEVCLKGFTSDSFVGSALVSMYGKCGSVLEAELMFNRLAKSDVVIWNSMISVYVDEAQGEKALSLYMEMQERSVPMDDATIMCILEACKQTGCIETCKQLHFNVVFAGFDYCIYIGSTLIRAYGSCASMLDSQTVFDGLPKGDSMLWNACIAGYAQKGDTATSLRLFEDMRTAGVLPNSGTFLSVLSACRHAGFVRKGVEYFTTMTKEYGLAPNMKHYIIMVDLLGRAGEFKKVEDILLGIPMQTDLSIWLCLLGACRTHGNVELGKQAFGHAITIKPKDATAYVLMTSIYADAGLHECAKEVERLRQRSCRGEEGAVEPEHQFFSFAEVLSTGHMFDQRGTVEVEEVYMSLEA